MVHKRQMSRSAKFRKGNAPPQLAALQAAIRAHDTDAVMDALAICSAEAGCSATPDANDFHRMFMLVHERPALAAQVKASMLASGVQPDETTLTLEVRGLVAAGELPVALELLETASPTMRQRLKLRAYAPLLQALCNQGDWQRAARLEALMAASGVALGEEQLVELALLSARVASGQVTTSAAGGDHAPVSFDTRMGALQKAQPWLSRDAMAKLRAESPSSLEARPASISEAGVCSHCGATLSALALTDAERTGLHDAILDAATRDGGRHHVEEFGAWLLSRPGGVTHIIDGPNVAYRCQNFVDGKFSFEQVEIVRAALAEASGGNPLIIMPQRYLDEIAIPNSVKVRGSNAGRVAHELGSSSSGGRSSSSSSSNGGGSGKDAQHTGDGKAPSALRMQLVTAQDAALVQRWRQLGCLWAVRDSLADDWFFMWATALGPHMQLVTIDEMRDHLWNLKLRERLSFARWKARHVVRFEFSHPSMPGAPPPKLRLELPPPYSHEIQQSAAAAPGAPTTWHLPPPPKAVPASGDAMRFKQQSDTASSRDRDDGDGDAAAKSLHGDDVSADDREWLCVGCPLTSVNRRT